MRFVIEGVYQESSQDLARNSTLNRKVKWSVNIWRISKLFPSLTFLVASVVPASTALPWQF